MCERKREKEREKGRERERGGGKKKGQKKEEGEKGMRFFYERVRSTTFSCSESYVMLLEYVGEREEAPKLWIYL